MGKRTRFLALMTSFCIFGYPSLMQAQPRHGISVFSDLKYSENFAHFDYVNPTAPKGGAIRTTSTSDSTSFDSFNPFILQGTPSPASYSEGWELLFDTLMVPALDTPDDYYGLIASSADIADDKKSVVFILRPEAQFSDGTAVSAQDVCNSFRLLSTQGSPSLILMLKKIASCEVLEPLKLRYHFQAGELRDLPIMVASLPVLSKAWYDNHDFSKSSLEPPLGSGPYKIGKFRQGDYVSFERRKDYWAQNLPVNRGRYNFDEIRLDYFRDSTAKLESFKSGQLNLLEEFIAKAWKTQYNFPAILQGKVKLLEVPDNTPSAGQGFYLNLRREKFQDIRVRKAFERAFDFEWSNANLFYNSYKRVNSLFENTDLEARGLPSPEELALLEPFKNQLSEEAYGPVLMQTISDGSGQDRKQLREASQLLDAAGWKLENGGNLRKNSKGESLSAEIIVNSEGFERVTNPYIQNLRLIGIDASFKNIDDVQFQERRKSFDFDMVVTRFAIGLTPGIELKNYFGSDTADLKGSANLSGIKNPVIDSLINNVINATSRPELNLACHALDRILRSLHFWVPNWYHGAHRIAYWDVFGHPALSPKYGRGILDTWWYAEKTGVN